DLSAITGKSGDCGGNSGITFTSAQTNYWINNAATAVTSTLAQWASASGGPGGTGRVPLPQDTARFDANSGGTSGTVQFDMPRIGSIDFTGYPTANTVANNLIFTIFGNLTHSSGSYGIAFWNNTQTFGGRGSQTITTAGKTLAFNPVFSAPGG